MLTFDGTGGGAQPASDVPRTRTSVQGMCGSQARCSGSSAVSGADVNGASGSAAVTAALGWRIRNTMAATMPPKKPIPTDAELEAYFKEMRNYGYYLPYVPGSSGELPGDRHDLD